MQYGMEIKWSPTSLQVFTRKAAMVSARWLLVLSVAVVVLLQYEIVNGVAY